MEKSTKQMCKPKSCDKLSNIYYDHLYYISYFIYMYVCVK